VATAAAGAAAAAAAVLLPPPQLLLLLLLLPLLLLDAVVLLPARPTRAEEGQRAPRHSADGSETLGRAGKHRKRLRTAEKEAHKGGKASRWVGVGEDKTAKA